MTVDKTSYPLGYPRNCLSKSALHFQPLRANPFDLGAETDWILLTFLVSFPRFLRTDFFDFLSTKLPLLRASVLILMYDNSHLHVP
jgi:hypothetical protein